LRVYRLVWFVARHPLVDFLTNRRYVTPSPREYQKTAALSWTDLLIPGNAFQNEKVVGRGGAFWTSNSLETLAQKNAAQKILQASGPREER
jgi:hypothetical protein